MKKRLKVGILLLSMCVLTSVSAQASNTVEAGSTGAVGSNCNCGPGGYTHYAHAYRTYSGGKTTGSGYMEIRYSFHKGSQHVKVGNVQGTSKSYNTNGSWGTGNTVSLGNVRVTETHSYSPY